MPADDGPRGIKPTRSIDPANLPPVLLAPELAQLLRCSAKQIYAKCKSGEIEHVRIGRDIRIPRVVAQRLLHLDDSQVPSKAHDSLTPLS